MAEGGSPSWGQEAAGWLSVDTHPPPDTGHRLGSELGQQVNSEASEPGALGGASSPVPLSRESLSSLSSLSNVLLEDETLEAEQLSRSFTASTSASGSGPGSPALAGGDNRGDYSEDGNFEATSSERERKGEQT